ncbi:hypothetical protein HY383_00775 [Candidatus Daviesbacteria bacterium]|nr:hypothetical protein [Candidatus Daviesbacteria bacterium]
MEQFNELLGQTIATINESTHTVTGINLNGHPEQRGVYKGLTREGEIILIQDTLVNSPITRGMIIRDKVIVKTVGLGRSRILRKITGIDLMKGFLGCQRYFQTNTEG